MLRFLNNLMIEKEPSHSNFLTWFSKHWRLLFAEFLSTLTHVLLECLTADPVPGVHSRLHEHLSVGMVVMFNIQIFGHVSGAYMNPSITLSAIIYGRLNPFTGLGHVLAQCVGAVAGYGILEAVVAMDLRHHAVCVTKPQDEQNYLQCLGIEIIITACLVLVMCSLWDPVNHDFYGTVPITVGLSMLGLSLTGGPFTGGSMNPARSLGPAIWTGIWTQHWIYWAGPLLGSSIGTLIYIIFFRNIS